MECSDVAVLSWRLALVAGLRGIGRARLGSSQYVPLADSAQVPRELECEAGLQALSARLISCGRWERNTPPECEQQHVVIGDHWHEQCAAAERRLDAFDMYDVAAPRSCEVHHQNTSW